MNKPPEELVSGLHETVCTSREDLSRLEQLQEQVLSRPQKSSACIAALPLPEGGTDMTGLLSTAKIRKIKPRLGAPDIITRLKETWVGRFYINHLKQISLVRRLIITLWRNLYFFYAHLVAANFSSRLANRWRPLVKLAVYVESLNIPTVKVFDAARVDTPMPKVFPAEDQAYLMSPHDHYVFPPVYVAQLTDTEVYGGTNLLFTHDSVICHDLYDFERDYTSEELHGRHVIDAKRKRMRLLCHDATPEKIAVAAAFVDACASNYAHWLTEVLPRIAVFCTVERFANVPVIVNDGLHPNIMESLILMIGSEREIVTLPVGRAVLVDRLYVTSVVGYVPFERRDTKLPNHSHGLFCPPAFQLIRDRCFSYIGNLPLQEWPRQVYLRRTSGSRRVVNGMEIEQALLKNGYVVVEPEKLSFVQQVILFNNASDLISPTGAALSNAIFSRQGTRCGILMAKHENMIYRYWLNMLASLGIEVSYILGTATDKSKVSIHSNCYIEMQHIFEIMHAEKRA